MLQQERLGTEPSQLDYMMSLGDINEQQKNEKSRLRGSVQDTLKASDEYKLDDLQLSYLSASVQDELPNLGIAEDAFPDAAQLVCGQYFETAVTVKEALMPNQLLPPMPSNDFSFESC